MTVPDFCPVGGDKMALLECRGLRLSYEGRTVLDELTFTVNKGDYLCIVGENGSGKSTLVRAILGLKTPDAGTLRFGDGLSRGEVGYLPQQTGAQTDFPASVGEIVRSGCRSRVFSLTDRRRSAARAAREEERMGLTALRRRAWSELSGGQRQRVLLARALCATERLLLLDEPVAGLDPLVTSELYEYVSRLNREGLTVIMVSHDIPASLRYATHILHLHNHPLYFGTVEGYKNSDACRRFLGLAEGGEGTK